MNRKLDQDFEKGLRRLEQGGVDRRTFIKALSAMGFFAMMGGTPKAYALSSGAKGRIVIVGGGAAGISMASRLSRWLKNPDITIIDPSDVQFYQPGFTMIGGGIYSPDQVYRPQASCMPDDVRWVKDICVELDPVSRKVYTKNSGMIPYDFLVLVPGLQMNFDAVEGISRDRLGEGNAHCIYDFQGAQKTWSAIKEFSEKGGVGIFTNTYTKLKCGGAPKKINLLTEDYCRRQGTRDRVNLSYFNASKNIFDTPYFAKRLDVIFRERNIAVHPEHRLKGIDTAAKKATFTYQVNEMRPVEDPVSGQVKEQSVPVTRELTVDYDFMHFTPPMSAPDFVRQAGLGWTSGSLQRDAWVMVDEGTLFHKTYPDIVSLGDVSGTRASKTSAAIRVQVPIAAKNLISVMEGKEPKEIYNGYSACPIITQYGKVLMAEFDYDKNPTPSFPFIDSSRERWIFWIMKKYMLKPLYFYGMLPGWM